MAAEYGSDVRMSSSVSSSSIKVGDELGDQILLGTTRYGCKALPTV